MTSVADNRPMIEVSLDEVQRDPASYFQRVEAGETVVVLQGGMPVAEIKPLMNVRPATNRRPFGLCAGEFVVPDDFDAPLPEAILQEFEGR